MIFLKLISIIGLCLFAGHSQAAAQVAEPLWVVVVPLPDPVEPSEWTARSIDQILTLDSLQNPYRAFRQSGDFKVRSLILPLTASLGAGLTLGILAYRSRIEEGDDLFFTAEHASIFSFNLAFYAGSGIAYGLTDAFFNAVLRRQPMNVLKGSFGMYAGPYFGILVPTFLISFTQGYAMGACLAVLGPTVAAIARYGRLHENLKFAAEGWDREHKYAVEPTLGMTLIPHNGSMAPTAGFSVRF